MARRGEFEDVWIDQAAFSPTLTLIHGDLMGDLPIDPLSIDGAFFSPPYMVTDGFTLALMRRLGRVLQRVLRHGSRAWMDFGQVKEGLDRPWLARAAMIEHVEGLIPWQTVAWIKSVAIEGVQTGHFQPINSPHLLNYAWEPVFQFVKGSIGDAVALDRLAIGVPYADESNLTRGTRGKNGNVHCAGDVWYVPYETTGKTKKKSHRHGFPPELVRRALKVSNLKPGQTVLDPFMGGGTTALVCAELGLNCVGIDRDENSIHATAQAWRGVTGQIPRIVSGSFPAPPTRPWVSRLVNPHTHVIELA